VIGSDALRHEQVQTTLDSLQLQLQAGKPEHTQIHHAEQSLATCNTKQQCTHACLACEHESAGTKEIIVHDEYPAAFSLLLLSANQLSRQVLTEMYVHSLLIWKHH
jgi:hypothetical protein